MAFAAAHNGGKFQVQSWFFGTAGDHPFLNLFKGAQQFANVTGGLSPDPSNLDSDGYPLTLVSGGVTTVVYLPTQAERPGNYKLTWDGSGTFSISGATVSSGSLSTSGVVLTPTSNKWTINITAIGSPPVTNIKLFHVNDETAINNGDIWGVEFLRRLREMNPGVIRFLDWQLGNTSNLAMWAHRTPVTAYSYRSTRFPSSLYQGTTSYALNGSSNDYSINLGASLPTNRQTVIVKISTSATNATNTFSVDNGVTKFPMLRPHADALTSSARWPLANRYATLIFDDELQAFLKYGGDGTQFDYGIDSGLPYELMVDLCATVGAHPYFVTPTVAVESPSDLLSGIATYCRDSGPSWFKPKFEPTNETWNSQFYAVSLAGAKQLVRNGGSTVRNATGLTWTGSGATGEATINFASNPPPLGAQVTLESFGGVFGFNSQVAYVKQVTGNDIKISRAPSGGTYTSGGTVTGTSNGYHDWYGQAASWLGQQISSVYSADRTKYDVFCGVQTTTTPSSSDPRLGAYSYVYRNNDTSLAAKNWITCLLTAQYYHAQRYSANQELIDSFNYSVTYAADAVNKAAVLQAYVDTEASGTTNDGSVTVGTLDTTLQGWKTWAQSFGIQKMAGYEGGYSPDYVNTGSGPTDATSAISGATQANPCVLTLATTNMQGKATNSNSPTPAAVVGMQLSIASVAGMTQLNGNTYTVSAINVGGDPTKVAINVDATGFSAYTSGGTATYVNSGKYIHALRFASKSVFSQYTHTRNMLTNFAALTDGTFTAEFPSCYLLAGASTGPQQNLDPGQNNTTAVWGVFDPSIYAEPNQSYHGYRLFSTNKRRFRITT